MADRHGSARSVGPAGRALRALPHADVAVALLVRGDEARPRPGVGAGGVVTAYAVAAPAYLARGWAPLPLPPRRKYPPPDGWTGYDAPYPSSADVQTWVEDRGHWNIGLRLPDTLLGLDVD